MITLIEEVRYEDEGYLYNLSSQIKELNESDPPKKHFKGRFISFNKVLESKPKEFSIKDYCYFDFEDFELAKSNIWAMKKDKALQNVKEHESYYLKFESSNEADGILKFTQIKSANEASFIKSLKELMKIKKINKKIKTLEDLKIRIQMKVTEFQFDDFKFCRSVSSDGAGKDIYFYLTRAFDDDSKRRQETIQQMGDPICACRKIIYHVYKVKGKDIFAELKIPINNMLNFEKIDEFQYNLQNHFEYIRMKYFSNQSQIEYKILLHPYSEEEHIKLKEAFIRMHEENDIDNYDESDYDESGNDESGNDESDNDVSIEELISQNNNTSKDESNKFPIEDCDITNMEY